MGLRCRVPIIGELVSVMSLPWRGIGDVDKSRLAAFKLLDNERGIIERKCVKLRFLFSDDFSRYGDAFTIDISGFGNSLHNNGGSWVLKRPIALAKPINTGTVDLQRYSFVAWLGAFCSLWLRIVFERVVRHSTCADMISSRDSLDWAAMSLNRVCTQKLNFSATGIPVNKLEK